MPDASLESLALTLVPEPQEWTAGAGVFQIDKAIVISVPDGAEEADRFAADDLATELKAEFDIEAGVGASGNIQFERREGSDLHAEGYEMSITADGVTISGYDAAGLFWGTRTLLQAIRPGDNGLEIPEMKITDWPDVELRSMHYDTKHHQPTFEYVQRFIRTLARYKANALVWEWEDKLAYERRPEIGAPGAFTKEQMQELTAYARQYHIQIIPLVQGLGHVSFILKHPSLRHLREIPNSSWEFCPLREETYEVLFDLWDEAMEATPGSEYCHIGSDETRELGLGEKCGCKAEAEEIGEEGLMKIFLDKCVPHIESRGRRAISWAGEVRPDSDVRPPKKMVMMSARWEERIRYEKSEGHDTMVYAPNPGIEPLHLSYFPWTQHSMWRQNLRRARRGSFNDTARTIAKAGKTGCVLGSITTSWDDSGLHNQAWMPRWVCAAEYSWNAEGVDVDVWIDRFFREYFGTPSANLRELYQILQDGSVFYYDTFQRRVWHWGDIGKIHIPDFPRQQLEYHPFWCNRYAQLLHKAQVEKQRIARALWIIDDNLSRDIRNRYDFELYRTVAELMRHNAELILMLGDLETAIGKAAGLHFSEREESLRQLESAQEMIEAHLSDRQKVYDNLVSKWEETRLPKGLSTPDKAFVWAPDRGPHLANRTPDMKYIIVDEELLGLEDYLEKLKVYIAEYKNNMDS